MAKFLAVIDIQSSPPGADSSIVFSVARLPGIKTISILSICPLNFNKGPICDFDLDVTNSLHLVKIKIPFHKTPVNKIEFKVSWFMTVYRCILKCVFGSAIIEKSLIFV